MYQTVGDCKQMPQTLNIIKKMKLNKEKKKSVCESKIPYFIRKIYWHKWLTNGECVCGTFFAWYKMEMWLKCMYMN